LKRKAIAILVITIATQQKQNIHRHCFWWKAIVYD